MQLTQEVPRNSCVCSYWGSYSLTIPGGSGAGNAVQLLTLPENAPEFFQFAAFKNGPLAAPTHPPAPLWAKHACRQTLCSQQVERNAATWAPAARFSAVSSLNIFRRSGLWPW